MNIRRINLQSDEVCEIIDAAGVSVLKLTVDPATVDSPAQVTLYPQPFATLIGAETLILSESSFDGD